MRRTFILLAIAVGASSALLAQGTIIFSNRTIDKADGTGTYHVPIWKSNGDYVISTVNPALGGAGTLPDGFAVGLFTGTGVQLLTQEGAPVQSKLRTDANAQFFATSLTAVVPGVNAGSVANIIVRGWQGVDSGLTYDQATRFVWLHRLEVRFVTKPLGGVPSGGAPPIPPPTMTGWGPESGKGIDLLPLPEPSAVCMASMGVSALALFRRKFRGPVT